MRCSTGRATDFIVEAVQRVPVARERVVPVVQGLSGGRGTISSVFVDEPHAPRRGRLKNGNPSGDVSKAARCGVRNGRCRMHGGKCTGPRTAAGLLNRIVAIKILPDTLAADPQFRERFDREARAISQLTHPPPRNAEKP